ncbi:MAG: DUF454 family protein, partial [Proteobacteria bacterium]|nr:DUF454 family protein [Pseudomonadota bacterium]
GNYEEFLLVQAERLATEAEAEYQRVSFIRREIDWIRRKPEARRTKAKARIDRFDAAVAAAPGSDDQLPNKLGLRLPTGPRLGGNIVELERVSKSLGGKLLFKDLTLVMKPGDRIGIVGPNGVGKTNLLEACATVLSGSSPRTSSELRLVRDGAEAARIAARVRVGDDEHDRDVVLRPGRGKQLRLDGAPARSVEEYGAQVPVVTFLLAHRRFGPMIRDWQAHGAVGRRAKVLALTAMAACAAILFATAPRTWMAATGTGVMALVALWLWHRPEPPPR